MSNWLDKFYQGTSTTTSLASILAVASEPGWNVLGTFPLDTEIDAKLDVIGSVSDDSLLMTVRIYCVEDGLVGEVTGSRATISSTIDRRAYSSRIKLKANVLYQVQAQVVGGAGDDFFGLVRRAAPLAIQV